MDSMVLEQAAVVPRDCRVRRAFIGWGRVARPRRLAPILWGKKTPIRTKKRDVPVNSLAGAMHQPGSRAVRAVCNANRPVALLCCTS